MRSSTALRRLLPGVILSLLAALGPVPPAAAEDGYLTITKADCARLARHGIPANGINYKGDIFIGEVVVDVASGRAIFNGQPLQSDEEAELAARCQRIVRDRAEQQ